MYPSSEDNSIYAVVKKRRQRSNRLCELAEDSITDIDEQAPGIDDSCNQLGLDEGDSEPLDQLSVQDAVTEADNQSEPSELEKEDKQNEEVNYFAGFDEEESDSEPVLDDHLSISEEAPQTEEEEVSIEDIHNNFFGTLNRERTDEVSDTEEECSEELNLNEEPNAEVLPTEPPIEESPAVIEQDSFELAESAKVEASSVEDAVVPFEKEAISDPEVGELIDGPIAVDQTALSEGDCQSTEEDKTFDNAEAATDQTAEGPESTSILIEQEGQEDGSFLESGQEFQFEEIIEESDPAKLDPPSIVEGDSEEELAPVSLDETIDEPQVDELCEEPITEEQFELSEDGRQLSEPDNILSVAEESTDQVIEELEPSSTLIEEAEPLDTLPQGEEELLISEESQVSEPVLDHPFGALEEPDLLKERELEAVDSEDGIANTDEVTPVNEAVETVSEVIAETKKEEDLIGEDALDVCSDISYEDVEDQVEKFIAVEKVPKTKPKRVLKKNSPGKKKTKKASDATSKTGSIKRSKKKVSLLDSYFKGL
ncbi:hypothetical protein MLD52_10275 [Puniceicoccaceae bacterium K14]|nr:hypothetical protein [Puniceicoccaceae bacterium K14]